MASRGQILLCFLVVGILSLAGSAKKRAHSCNVALIDKRPLANGRVDIHQVSLIYSCKNGYKLLGGAKRYCRNGRISGRVPQCVRDVSCGVPFLADGSFSGTDFTVGARITYKCNRGFEMIGGKKTSTCKRNGKWSNIKPTCQNYNQCGVSRTVSRARVVGGSVSSHGVWPWMTRIYRIRNGKEQLVCGAALIRRQWVLTAAQCFFSFNIIFKRITSEAWKPRSYFMALGDHNAEVPENSERHVVAEKIFVHQDYNYKDFVNDIALVKLSKKVALSKYVRTLCLPDKDLLVPEKHGFVAGWGRTEVIKPGTRPTHRPSTVLRESAFTIQKDSLCLNKTSYYVNPNVTFCAGDGNGRNDTCSGDSGGPFTQEGLVDGKYRWMATGVVSWGEGCGQKDKYGYYTRVLPFVDWINKTISNNTVNGDDDE